jgi:hypothetical protein
LGTATWIVRGIDSLIGKLKPGTEYYLTSFVDYRSSDGLFRKIRFFFIGDRIIIRHQLVSDHWNVHGADRDRFMSHRPTLLDDERRLIEAGIEQLPPITRTALAGIRRAIGLDFFGLDCSLLADGRLILFEANATMNFLHPSLEDPRFPHLRQSITLGREAFKALLA